MSARRLSWLGVRTDRFDESVGFYRDVLGLPLERAGPGAAWFRLADGTGLHVYGPPDEDHAFFGSAPVVALWVDEFEATRARMTAAGVEFVGEPQRDGGVAWNHYRGTDGNVYELMGPDEATEDSTLPREAPPA